MTETVLRKRSTGVKSGGTRGDVAKARRLLAGRTGWLAVRDNRTGAPYLVVQGDHGGHTVDLVSCSCQRAQFLPHSIETACTHTLAVRLWYTALRTGRITDVPGEPHRRLRPDDLAHFDAQDAALANVADSLLIQYQHRLDGDAPVDDPGDDPARAADAALAADRRRLALVDDPDLGGGARD